MTKLEQLKEALEAARKEWISQSWMSLDRGKELEEQYIGALSAWQAELERQGYES